MTLCSSGVSKLGDSGNAAQDRPGKGRTPRIACSGANPRNDSEDFSERGVILGIWKGNRRPQDPCRLFSKNCRLPSGSSFCLWPRPGGKVMEQVERSRTHVVLLFPGPKVLGNGHPFHRLPLLPVAEGQAPWTARPLGTLRDSTRPPRDYV